MVSQPQTSGFSACNSASVGAAVFLSAGLYCSRSALAMRSRLTAASCQRANPPKASSTAISPAARGLTTALPSRAGVPLRKHQSQRRLRNTTAPLPTARGQHSAVGRSHPYRPVRDRVTDVRDRYGRVCRADGLLAQAGACPGAAGESSVEVYFAASVLLSSMARCAPGRPVTSNCSLPLEGHPILLLAVLQGVYRAGPLSSSSAGLAVASPDAIWI